jgi:hypothetical protein
MLLHKGFGHDASFRLYRCGAAQGIRPTRGKGGKQGGFPAFARSKVLLRQPQRGGFEIPAIRKPQCREKKIEKKIKKVL